MRFCCSLHPTALRAARNQLSSLILDLIPRKQSCMLPGITFLSSLITFQGGQICVTMGLVTEWTSLLSTWKTDVLLELDGLPSERRVDPETALVHTYAHVNVLRNPEGLSPVWVISDAGYFCHCLISCCYLFHE